MFNIKTYLIKPFLILLLLQVYSSALYSQEDESVMDEKQIKALEKEKRQAEKREEEEEQKKIVDYMVNNKKFVLEANYLSGKSGSRIPVNSTINFIIIDSAKATIQLANGWGSGYNGLGGITVNGQITKYDMHKKEGKRRVSYTITLYVMSTLGMYDIQFWVNQTGNADASISGNTYGRLNYSGKLVSIELSRIYKGQSYP